MRYQGDVAIVTGAGSGIGRAVAERLAGEGAVVVVADLSQEAAEATAARLRARGSDARACALDVRRREQVKDVVARAAVEAGRIDVLVNSAGVNTNEDFMDVPDATWDSLLDVHVRGTYNLIWAVAPFMKERRGGRIVNVASISGRFGRPMCGAYAAAKAAVINMTYSAAVNLAEWNVTVNAVCPGVIDTPMQSHVAAQRAQLFGIEPEEALRQAVAAIPLRRMGSPAEVAAAIAFLASPEAAYISGQTLNVDGGWHHH